MRNPHQESQPDPQQAWNAPLSGTRIQKPIAKPPLEESREATRLVEVRIPGPEKKN